MTEALARLEKEEAVRCIVVTGAGDKAFCAGADIHTLLPLLQKDLEAGTDDPQLAGVTHREGTSKPMLAAVNGIAFGGGLELALSCDMRIASTRAKFGLPEIKLGLLAGAGGCVRLPRTIPAALAAEMILTGEPIDAQRALAVGLISKVVEPAELLAEAVKLASVVASRSPGALRTCTALLRRPKYAELQAQLREERDGLGRLLLSPDGQEGVDAFVNKRAPTWRGSWS
jgi:enoyl-CoA hydratase/E-phenylitaconyl-CoA hydratase